MSFNISKELFEEVVHDTKFCGITEQNEIKFTDEQVVKQYISINDFFFKCIDFVATRGYIFSQNTDGFSMIKHTSSEKRKFWEDEEFNKQRLFDACQWILENKEK